MSKNELQKIWALPIDLPYKEKVEHLQKSFFKLSEEKSFDVEHKNNCEDVLYPSTSNYKHYFSNGLYVREMFVSGGYFGFTGIHNLANPLFVMKGIMWCTTKDGVQKLEAPKFVLTEPGTKRICWFPEDSIVITVHPNPEGITDIDKIEKMIASGNWEQYEEQFGEYKEENEWKHVKHREYYVPPSKKVENKQKKLK